MPAVRLARRRRSSLAISFTPAKAGIYGIPRPVTFAPNVTPITYEAPEGSSSSSTPEPSSPTSALFPPSETPAPPPSRRRVPPGKRRSMGYIPRPPNAFMLFRADFVRQKHVPGTIETNHGSLSKIIGNCWRSLPLEEKRVWEVKAKHAKAEHKARYPEYRFRPVHNKNKDKKKEKALTTVEDERRCEEVAQLLLEGKKGDELAAAVRDLDLMRAETPSRHTTTNTNTHQDQVFHHRRSSSVPLPNDYYPHFPGMPFQPAPFFAPGSRPPTPLARQQRMMLGSRRASSARPATATRSWTLPLPGTTATMLQRDDSPLPDVDTSLFEPSFLDAAAGFTFPVYDNQHHQQQQTQFDMGMHMNMNGYEHGQCQSQGSFGPLDNISPHDILASSWAPHPNNASSPYDSPDSSSLSSSSFNTSNSHPSTAYSGSPAYSEPLPLPLPLSHPLPLSLSHSHPNPHPNALPHPHELPMQVQVHAPQPQSASAAFADMWKEFGGGSFSSDPSLGMEGVFNVDGMGLGLGLEFSGNGNGNGGQEVRVGGGGGGGMDMGCVQQQQGLGQGDHVFGGELESLFAPQGYDGVFGNGVGAGGYEGMGMGMGMEQGMAA